MTRLQIRVAVALLAFGTSMTAGAQSPVDSALVAYIASIRAIDNHAHPMRPVQSGAPVDTEFDALPLDAIPPFPLPWRLRLENPEWRAAQAMLFDIPNSGSDEAFRARLHARRAQELRARRRKPNRDPGHSSYSSEPCTQMKD